MSTYYITEKMPEDQEFIFIDRVFVIDKRFVSQSVRSIDNGFLLLCDDPNLILLETIKGNIQYKIKCEYLEFHRGLKYDLQKEEFITSFEALMRSLKGRTI